MDLGSLYLKVFLGARPFESPGLDSLAGRMDALRLLSGNPRDRYFTIRARVAALSLGNKVLFGAGYYDHLTEGQRLAAGAHEFAHILGRDGRYAQSRLVVPSLAVSFSLALAALMGTGSVLLCELVCLGGLLATLSLSSRLGAERSQRQELRCDSVAASFVGGRELIEAIRIGVSLSEPDSRRTRKRKRPSTSDGSHPSLEKRIETIGRAGAAAGPVPHDDADDR